MARKWVVRKQNKGLWIILYSVAGYIVLLSLLAMLGHAAAGQ